MSPADMRTRTGMSACQFRWFMLRQRLPESSPEAIPDLPAARVIRGEDPHTLFGLLGLGKSRHMLPSTTVLDLGSLGAGVEDEGDQGRNVAGEPLYHAVRSVDLRGSWWAASFNIAATPSVTPPLPRWIGMTMSSSPAGPVTSRTRRSSVRRSFMSHSRWTKNPLRVDPCQVWSGAGM